jgi:polyisoprenoid-binding protein YceI
MLRNSRFLNMFRHLIALFVLGFAATLASAQGQETTLNFVPSQTEIHFTLGDVLHTVHGTFELKSGEIHFVPATRQIGGMIVVDAASGQSGSGGRDRKMNKDVLESARYPDVTFRPDRVDGDIAASGSSTVQVHGRFGIHGAEHEITVPAQVELAPDHWNLAVHFNVPYVQWGMKDPSTFVLRVGKTVAIDMRASGLSRVAQR